MKFLVAVPKVMVAIFVSAMIISFLAGHSFASSDPLDDMGIIKMDPSRKAPGFTLKDTTGKKVSLGQYEGKALFVTFWATW